MTLPYADLFYAARLSSELDDLDRAESFLDAPDLRPILPDGAARSIHALVRDCREALLLCQGDVDWPAFREARQRAAAVRTELFCLLQTTLFRREGYDGELLDAAEGLVTHLQSLALVRRPVMLALSADAESLDGVVSMVRLRFPGTTVWHLPVLAHEYGHHVAANLGGVSELTRDARPLHDVIERAATILAETTAARSGPSVNGTRGYPPDAGEAQLRVARAQIGEYVADMFATYALGGSYPLSCIALRIDPGTASQESDTHPPWDRRVEAMAATLEAISARLGEDRHGAMATEVIRPLWSRVSRGPAVGVGEALILSQLAESVVAELMRHTEGLLYDDADRAVALGQSLDSNDDAPELPKATVATVLDAAWRWRRSHWDAEAADLERVNRIVLRWCRQVSERAEVPARQIEEVRR